MSGTTPYLVHAGVFATLATTAGRSGAFRRPSAAALVDKDGLGQIATAAMIGKQQARRPIERGYLVASVRNMTQIGQIRAREVAANPRKQQILSHMLLGGTIELETRPCCELF